MCVFVLEMQQGHTKCTLNIAHSRVKEHCFFSSKQNTNGAGCQEWPDFYDAPGFASAPVLQQHVAFLKNNIRSCIP